MDTKNPNSQLWFLLGLLFILVSAFAGAPTIVVLFEILITLFLYANMSLSWLTIAKDTIKFKHMAQDSVELLAFLKNAIKNDEFVLHYQTQVDMKTKKPIGVEALIRWNHPNLGLIYPDQFIPLAEHNDLITVISMWVVNQALRDLKRLREGGFPEFTMAINMSPYCKISDELLSIFKHGFAAANVAPSNVTFEITEAVISMSQTHTIKILKELDTLGVKLSIDDFGTGQSSLLYLRSLPISELKIDREFVTGMLTNEQDFYIVQSIISLAKGLQCKTVAEGIENKEVFEALVAMECGAAQGYYISKPMEFAGLVKTLDTLHE